MWNFYKFVLKSVKSLNRILWFHQSWFKASKCQIWLTNAKSLFWETEANVETLQKSSPYIWVSYNFVLKSVKILSRILWARESCFKALKCQIWLGIQNHFSGKARETFKLPKNFLPIFDFSIISFEVWQKPQSNLMNYGILVQCFQVPNLVDDYKTGFLGRRGKRWNAPKTFSLYFCFL